MDTFAQSRGGTECVRVVHKEAVVHATGAMIAPIPEPFPREDA